MIALVSPSAISLSSRTVSGVASSAYTLGPLVSFIVSFLTLQLPENLKGESGAGLRCSNGPGVGTRGGGKQTKTCASGNLTKTHAKE